jgi:hypothetical protein
MTRSAVFAWLLTAAIGIGAAPAPAEDCVDFRWDVARERALYAVPATALTAGADAKTAPALQIGHLYELKLLPQDQVTFSAKPDAKHLRNDSHAGLATFTVPKGGRYRVSIDMPFWIDVVRDGAAVAAVDFQGQHGCNPPHKIVEFDLSGSRPFILQFSNAAPQSVRLTITETPARKL